MSTFLLSQHEIAFIYTRAVEFARVKGATREALATYSTRPLGEREDGAQRSAEGERTSCFLEGERN